MQREIDLKEISDGKLYGPNDMVKADCNGCNGCHACCRGMGTSIVLDPLDIHRMVVGLSTTFESLLAGKIELNVVDGIILPNLAMNGNDEQCAFLDGDGRCSIHAIRPGICRIFPLGRFYENNAFKYFLQVYECPKPNKTKVKVKKWIDVKDIKGNDEYINLWHYFLKDIQDKIQKADEQYQKNADMYILQKFYMTPYDSERDFYDEFRERIDEAKSVL